MIYTYSHKFILFIVLFLYMQTNALTGRVLDEARLMPVMGAVVSAVGGSEQDTTDEEGRFELFAQAGIIHSRGAFPVMYTRGDALFLFLARKSLVSIEMFGISGKRTGESTFRILEEGSHQVGLSGLFPDNAGISAGFVRVRLGGTTRVFKIIRLTSREGYQIKVTRSRKGPLAKTAEMTAAGQIQVTKELLNDTTVAFSTDDEDLGDIILHYPLMEPGVGAPPIHGAQVLFDGTRESLDENWQMWQSPWRIDNGLEATPVTWEMVDDPVDDGQVVSTNITHHRKWYAREEIVTKKNYRDFQVHLEFNVSDGGNSGVYLQNRYEIQVTDGGGVGHVYGEVDRTSDEYAGTDKWNSYDITFRAARWDGETRTKKAMLTMWWNGVKVHENVEADETHGMNFEGEEDQWFVPGGELVDPSDQGLKFQNHGLIVRYRNVWILELDIEDEDTDFRY